MRYAQKIRRFFPVNVEETVNICVNVLGMQKFFEKSKKGVDKKAENLVYLPLPAGERVKMAA